MNKRDWLHQLQRLKTEPRPLTADECDELLDLLGGGRPNHRPVKLDPHGERQRLARAKTLADTLFDHDASSRAEAIRQFVERQGCADPKRAAKAVENELEWLRQQLELPRLNAKSWAEYIRQQPCDAFELLADLLRQRSKE